MQGVSAHKVSQETNSLLEVCFVNVDLEQKDIKSLVVYLVLASIDLEEPDLLQHSIHISEDQDIFAHKIQIFFFIDC